jgi:hypothetical protein
MNSFKGAIHQRLPTFVTNFQLTPAFVTNFQLTPALAGGLLCIKYWL